MSLQKPLFGLLFSIISIFTITSQNLIIDPGFEEVDFVFDGKDTVYSYMYWKSLLPLKKSTSRGIPSYSKYLKNVPTDKYRSYWIPFEGDSYLFSHYVYYKNLFQTKLSQRLEVGSKYKIAFHYKILSDGYGIRKIEDSINKKIGVLFTENDISTDDYMSKFKDSNYKIFPHFAINKFKGESIDMWLKFEHIFEASKAFNYLTIGNFEKIIEVHELTNYPIRGMSFRIDLVTLERVEDTILLTANIENIEGEDIKEVSDTINLATFKIMESSVLNYYAYINEAESSILESKFDSAFIYYLKAFNIRSPFFRDFRNAKSVMKHLDSPDSLLLRQFHELTQFSRNNKSYISFQIDSLHELDQGVRIAEDKIDAQDSSNHDFVMFLFMNNPISEFSIGINSMRNLEIVLLHLSRYQQFSELIPLISEQVSNGNFNNRTFANLIDTYYEYNISHSKTNSLYLTHSIFPVFSQFLFPDLDSDFIKEVNKKRAAIGLEGLQDQYKKQFYNFKNGYREYEFYQFFNYFPSEEMCTEDEKRNYLEKEKILVEELMQKYENIVIWSK